MVEPCEHVAAPRGTKPPTGRFFTTTLSGRADRWRRHGGAVRVCSASCLSQYAAGEWVAVRRSADEAVSLARSIGQPSQGFSFPFGVADASGCTAGRRRLRRPARPDPQAQVARVATAGGDGRVRLRGAQLGPGDPSRRGTPGDTAESFHHFTQRGVATVCAWPPRRASRRPSTPETATAQQGSTVEAFGAASDLPWALAAAYPGALCAGRGGARAIRDRAAPPRRRTPPLRRRRPRGWPSASICAGSGVGSMPAPTSRTPWRRSVTWAPNRWCSARPPGAPCLRRDRPQTRPLHADAAHPDRAPHRPARRPRAEQQGRRPKLLDLTPDRGVPPPRGLLQDRRHLPERAGPPRPHLTPSLPGPVRLGGRIPVI